MTTLHDRLRWADAIVRSVARDVRRSQPVEMGDETGSTGGALDCGEVPDCGGMCPSCRARRYVERYTEPVPGRLV